MIYEKQSKGPEKYQDLLTLANGDQCPCYREVKRKGVPRVKIPWVTGGENIDLFPEGFLWDRGCTILRGTVHTIQTPKDRVIHIKMWGTLPYILKDDLQRILDDLPEDTQEGRSGTHAQVPTAARVCRTNCTPAQIRNQLKHLRTTMSKEKLNNVSSKYRDLPEQYYGGVSDLFVTPEVFSRSGPSFIWVVRPGKMSTWTDGTVKVKLDPSRKESAQMWEWFSGSASLSNYFKQEKISHLPPIGYRYGWNLSIREHQELLLDALLTVGVETLFASPNCAPWGNNSRSMSSDYREGKRAEETPTLQFLAVACFFPSAAQSQVHC